MTSLEAAENEFYNEGTEDALRAYADALTAAGEPLGSLIALELAADLDPLERNIQRAHPEIHKLRAKILNPRLQPRVTPQQLRWKDGLVEGADVRDSIRKPDQWLGVLLSNRAGRAVSQLGLMHSKKSCNFKRALAQLVERGTPNLRKLDVSQSGSTGFDGLKGFSDSAPRLEALHLRGKMSPGGLRALATPWPNLHTLMVDFDLTPVWKKKPQSGKKLAGLFEPGALPKLRWLRLERTGFDDTLLERMTQSGVLAHLEFLQVGGFFSEAAAAAFLTNIPLTCQCLITRYEPHADHQTVVDIVYRGVHAQQEEDYAALWKPLEETNWWENGVSFDGAQLDVMPRNSQTVISALADGTLHGRQSMWQTRNGEITWRRDTMYWHGVEHGNAFIRKGTETTHQRFLNGLRDESGETFGPDGTLLTRWVIAQGVTVEDYNAARDHHVAAEEALRARFGVDFTTEDNPLYTLGPAKDLRPEHKAISQIAKNLDRTDDGMRVHDLIVEAGGGTEVVLWSAGDTTCGVILDGHEVLGVIEDMNIRLP